MAGQSRRYAYLLASTALTSLLFIQSMVLPARAQNLPTGGSVAAGSVAIAQPSATQLTITQSSQSAVVNWTGFSVGQGSTVNIAQPNSSSALLNRVTGSVPSTIAGQITANGQVYLVNPNGIAITKSGTVDTGGGFVASTLGISDSDFMAGKRTFTGDGASAAVSNAGTIQVGRGGYAALIGGTVSNSGAINVPLGKVGLGSGERATLDFSGDGFLQVAVPTTAGGKHALIRNSGTIKADGGSVVISAATAREAARNAINISGVVQARSIGGHNGSIIIGGGAGGRVRITGRLDASSRRHAGGSIQVTGKAIALKGATINASGKTGGGSVNIGGSAHGAGPLPNADTVTIDAATTITASATQSGNGGDVVVWSDLMTTFAGTISAKGGEVSGNGGSAEVSSHGLLNYTGVTDLSAANGAFGTLLLDPYNVIISSGAPSNGSFDGTTPTNSFTPSGNDSVINNATLQTALATANVTISTGSSGTQAGNITVNAPVTWSSGSLLTLTAANAVAVNANITVTGAGKVALNAGLDTATVPGTSLLQLSFAQGSSLSFTGTGGALSINGTAYTLVYSMAQLDAIDGQLATNGGGSVTAYGAGVTGNYALAGNLDASGTTYTDAIVAGQGGQNFSGTLEGLGHTVSNLTINSGNIDVGLIGRSSGNVRDIGIVGGAVNGNSYVGDLIGSNSGTINNVYATGAVSGSAHVGGLVGLNSGTINNAYATGDVSGSNQAAGGLAGNQLGGTISNAFATGAVSGDFGGGLVGVQHGGTISNAYATGAVSGGDNGGLVANGISGVINNAYWDTQTTGQSGSSGGTGLTTTQLQSGSATGLGSAFGGGANGLYPYLTSFFPNGVQTVSGTVYSDAGATANAGVSVGVVGNGTLLGTGSSGANGYYYVAGAAGTMANGATLLSYAGTNAVTLTASTGAVLQTGVNIYGNALTVATSATSLSAAPTLAQAQTLALAAAGNVPAAATAINGAPGQGFVASATAGFTIDQTVNTANTFYVQTTASGAPITVSNPITVASGGSLGLNAAGGLAVNANITTQGAVSVALSYDQSTTVPAVSDLSFGLTAAGFTGGLTYLDANGTALTSSPGNQSLTVNGASYTLLYSMTDLQTVNNSLGGAYALAGNINAVNTTYTDAIVAGQGQTFSGTLEGLGHTVSNLQIQGNISNVGLIGSSSGNVLNIGVVGGAIGVYAMAGGLVGTQSGGIIGNAYTTLSVSGDGDASSGGLVGNQSGGAIVNAYATGTVNGYSAVGGLVGTSSGTISNAFATGAVNGDAGGVGGLVGEHENGTISNAYATGAVAGSPNGGLIGVQFRGTINNVYATGAVSGNNSFGRGLIGGQSSGTNNNAYWDTQTTGQQTSFGTSSGMTTAQLQGTLPSGFDPAVWGTGAGLYPYLKSFYPIGVQAVSGTVYSDGGATANAGTSVSVIFNGATFGSASSGANGYYYVPSAANTIGSGQNLIAYTSSAATLATSTGASAQTGVNIYGNALTVPTTATLLSNLPDLTAAKTTAIAAANGNVSAVAAINSALGQGFVVSDPAGFTINQSVNIANTFVVQTTVANAPIMVSSPVTVASGGSLGLNAAGALAVNANITAQDTASVALNAGLDTTTVPGTSLLQLSFAQGSSLSFTGTGGALSINGTAYTLVYSMAQLDAIDGQLATNGGGSVTTYGVGLGGNYALAGNLDAGGTTYTDAIVAGQGGQNFSGTLEGLGHTVSNLTINSGNTDVGLIGRSSGNVRDIGIMGGTVSGSDYVGDLVGLQFGTISNAYATGTVNGSGNYTGGLVGSDLGTISDAYATGTVTGGQAVGGLVGFLSSGTISNATATGAVSGGAYIGGLVGYLADSTISNAIATGAVNGGSNAGGLVGAQSFSTVNKAYWDTQTTGQSGASGGTGLTTAQLQGALPSGFSSSVWGTGTGLYPYLKSFYPTGLQAVSGTAYTDAGVTPAATGANGAIDVSVLVNGAAFGSAATGANGYYYVVGSANSIANGNSLLAFTQANSVTGAKDAATYTVASASANSSGVNVYGGWKLDNAPSTVTSLSALNTFETGAAGASAAASFTLDNRDIRIASVAFDINATVNLTGTLALNSTGTVTQSTGTIAAASLQLAGTGGGFALTQSGNAIATVAADTGSVSLANTGALSTGSVGNASGTTVAGITTTGAVSLVTTGSLTLAAGAPVSGASAVLAAGGAFINSIGATAVTATTGRWLVYAASDGGATSFNNLDSGNTAIWNSTYATLAPADVTRAGDRYIFANQPVLTFTSTSSTKTYGDTASLSNLYTVSGYHDVANAFTTDTASSAYSGAPTITSSGAAASAGVAASPHTIDIAAGNLASASGYSFAFASNGTLTVDPADITVTALGGTSVYGSTATNPGLSATGLKNNQNVSVLTGLSNSFGISGTSGVGSSPYALTVAGTLSNANYNVTSTVNGSWIVTPANITVTAVGGTSVYGSTPVNPGLSATGLQNSESASVLTGLSNSFGITGTSGVGSSPYTLTVAGTLSNANYNVTSTVNGSWSVTPADITVTAVGGTSVYGSTPANPGLSATGLQNGESASILTGLSNSFGITGTSGVGSSPYTLTVAGTLSNANYNVTSTVNGSWIVTPAPVTVAALSGTSQFGTAPVNPGLSATGLQNGESASVLTGLSNSFGVTSSTPPGNVALTVAGVLANADYIVTQRIDGVWDVTGSPSAGAWPASIIANENFYPIALPNIAAPLFGVPPVFSGVGIETLYADPRFSGVFVCFGGGVGTAASCVASAAAR